MVPYEAAAQKRHNRDEARVCLTTLPAFQPNIVSANAVNTARPWYFNNLITSSSLEGTWQQHLATYIFPQQ